MVRVRLLLLTAILVAMPTLGAAKPAQPQINVPDQPWYPPGYRDLRIAAGETMLAFPRDPDVVLWHDWNDPAVRTYDVIDCNLGYDLPPNPDWQATLRELLALDIARMRTELHRLGYRAEVYDQPLLDYERASLAHFPVVEQVLPYDPDGPTAEADRAAAEAVAPENIYDPFWGLDELSAKLEANRKRLQPGKPRIIMEGGCGAGETEFSVALSPPDGRLWLINAFAFKVCERKVADPWDHGACGWSEFISGDTTTASGRYMYEARWPNGTVRRGAKVLQETEDGGAIVIRRN